jgi:hypothetical protein
MPKIKKISEDDTRCAPHIKYTDGSCFSLEQLIKISKSYNKNNTDKIIISNDKIKLVEQLNKKLSHTCSTQTCWLKLDFIKTLEDEDINENTLRPKGPKEKYEWLSTLDINNVVSQYHYKYDDFLFLGAVQYDFESLTLLGLSNINFNELIQDNKVKIGLVINLDEHYKSGSHWVALYFDLLKCQVYYFDSYGIKPKKRIKKFITKIVKFLYKNKYNEDLNLNKYLKKPFKNIELLQDKIKDFDIRYNQIRHQFKNSECGVYSINFILRLVKGESFDDITQNITYDDKINKCREVYFVNKLN